MLTSEEFSYIDQDEFGILVLPETKATKLWSVNQPLHGDARYFPLAPRQISQSEVCLRAFVKSIEGPCGGVFVAPE